MKRKIDPSLAAAATAADSAWSLGGMITDKYRPSRKRGEVTRGVSSSSDKVAGNLHALVRPLVCLGGSVGLDLVLIIGRSDG